MQELAIAFALLPPVAENAEWVHVVILWAAVVLTIGTGAQSALFLAVFAAFWQVLVFLLLSLVSAYLGNRLMGGRNGQSDQPLLNRRSEQLIGRTATLSEPIREGRGRIQLGDTLWLVSGPDLPTGTRVRVASVQGSELVVEPV